MNLVSLTDCCRWLAIDPKTLHHWMSFSQLEAQPHPLDARRKCLTREQVQQLALLHRRTLVPDDGLPQTSVLETETPVKSEPVPPERAIFISGLLQQLGSLQAQVLTLQHQLTLLTHQWAMSQPYPTPDSPMLPGLSLNSSQDKSLEPSQDKSLDSSQDKSLDSSQDKPLEPSQDKSLDSSQDKSLDSSQDKPSEPSQDKSLDSSQDKSLDSSQDKSLEPSQEKESRSAKAPPPLVDRRKRPCVLPLVEYGTQGKYVVITPEQGLLDFEPDSPEWFAWLSTLTSFRFVGASGHLTVHRNKCHPSWSWRATRSIRYRTHSLPLAPTESLTLAVLEQAAASLQSLLN